MKNPNSVQSNLRDIISETNFNSSFKNNCTYYVYHTGILYYLKVIDKTNNQILYKIGISKKETPKYRIRSLRSSALRNSNIVLDIEILHYKQYELYTAFCLEQKIL